MPDEPPDTGETGGEQAVRDSRGRFVSQSANATSFQPGQSGNLNGRRGSIVDALRRKLRELGRGGNEHAEIIADALIKRAEKGDVQAAREILDRIDGKPRQSVDVDMTLRDWRELAAEEGLDIRDVVREAEELIREVAGESAIDEGSTPGDREAP